MRNERWTIQGKSRLKSFEAFLMSFPCNRFDKKSFEKIE